MSTHSDILAVHRNLTAEDLLEHALKNGEGQLASNGALTTVTGQRTGRSPHDRFIVNDANTEQHIDWGSVNQPIAMEKMDALWQRVEEWLEDRSYYYKSLHAGADIRYYLPLHVRTETAWHSLFAHNMFIRPESFNPKNYGEWQILNAPSFECVPHRDGVNSDGAVILDFSRRRILLAGMRYAGEMKKAVFSTLNYLLPEQDVLPMHCAANVAKSGKVFLFFGLSGTGKTTLSADPSCALIGDDEHGWGEGSVFNFEGGCYAKCINLKRENEPVIWDAIRRGSIMENVVLDANKVPDLSDRSITENTRCCYPREYIENRISVNFSGEPSAVIFLTCDLNGVMPPVSVLSPEAAAYHFLSGYTASMAGVEVGAAVKSTFSQCFGAPFFPRAAREYADLLIKRIHNFDAKAYLVNTGWTGGGYGVGKRFDISVTRAIVRAIQDGKLENAKLRTLQPLNLEIPLAIEGLDPSLLDPGSSWQDQAAYEATGIRLAKEFTANFERFSGVAESIKAAGPQSV